VQADSSKVAHWSELAEHLLIQEPSLLMEHDGIVGGRRQLARAREILGPAMTEMLGSLDRSIRVASLDLECHGRGSVASHQERKRERYTGIR